METLELPKEKSETEQRPEQTTEQVPEEAAASPQAEAPEAPAEPAQENPPAAEPAPAQAQPEPDAPEASAPEAEAPREEPAPVQAQPKNPEEPYPQEEAVIAALRRRTGIRAEWILGAVALLAAVVLAVTIVVCLPYFGAKDEDPEDLPDYHQQAQEETTEPFLEPTESETEPENPTIPPERNPYDRYDFQYNRQNYLVLQNLKSSPGIDVSAHQGQIDWDRVRSSGIEFAIIRLGYRGYGSGKLVEDEYAQANLEGATKAGLKIGAYFFSQALNIQEVDEEMDFMLRILGDYNLDMPIILDWEIPASDARTANGMDARTLTDLQRHFCGNMERKGYRPMVYFNWHQSETLYYLSELEEYEFWLALYQDRMTYPWRVEMWQYSDQGKVPGINGPVDLNVYLS